MVFPDRTDLRIDVIDTSIQHMKYDTKCTPDRYRPLHVVSDAIITLENTIANHDLSHAHVGRTNDI